LVVMLHWSLRVRVATQMFVARPFVDMWDEGAEITARAAHLLDCRAIV